MGKLAKTLGFSSNKTVVESLDEVGPPGSPKPIHKSQSVSDNLSQKSEKSAKKEKKENGGQVSNHRGSLEDKSSTNDEDSSSKKKNATVFNGLARRATIMRQKSLDNIIQASKRMSMMPSKPKAHSEPVKPSQSLQSAILSLPTSLLTNILFKSVFWTTLEFDYEQQILHMRTLSLVCKKFFDACHSTPEFWSKIWHAMTKSSDRENPTFNVDDAKSLKKECLKIIFYKTPYRKGSIYGGRHRGNPQLKLTMCASDTGLGEHNLVMRLRNNTYHELCDPRIEEIYNATVRIDGETSTLEMLVVAHQEEFSSLRKQWVEPADGLVLVYGCDKRSSFEQLEQDWVKLAAEAKGIDASLIPKILVCNKIDVPIAERTVTRAEGLALAQKLNCPYIETSGKKRINIEELFEDIVREIRLARFKHYLSTLQESSEPLAADEPVDLP